MLYNNIKIILASKKAIKVGYINKIDYRLLHNIKNTDNMNVKVMLTYRVGYKSFNLKYLKNKKPYRVWSTFVGTQVQIQARSNKFCLAQKRPGSVTVGLWDSLLINDPF